MVHPEVATQYVFIERPSREYVHLTEPLISHLLPVERIVRCEPNSHLAHKAGLDQ